MFDINVLSQSINEMHEIELFGKKYIIKNCVRVLEHDIIKLCAVLETEDSKVSVFIDLKEYQQEVKHV